MNKQLKGFMDFIKEQGVIGLAVGVILGAAAGRVVTAIVDDFIQPVISLLLGKVPLEEKAIVIGNGVDGIKGTADDIMIRWGSFLATLVDFIIVAAVVYFVIKKLVDIMEGDKKKK